jgi:hypothetical protein
MGCEGFGRMKRRLVTAFKPECECVVDGTDEANCGGYFGEVQLGVTGSARSSDIQMLSWPGDDATHNITHITHRKYFHKLYFKLIYTDNHTLHRSHPQA